MRLRPAAVVLAFVVALVAGAWLLAARSGGFSTRAEPTAVERVAARLARRLAVPQRARSATNPVSFSPEGWAQARAHYADHCATCHANDGSGQTEIGRNLFPKAPDMRLAETQTLSDGELYWIIENGVRLTGMPAWGTGRDDDEDTWKLVHFIRRLKELTPEDIKDMEGLNPKTPGELKEEEDDKRFLAGEDVTSPPTATPHHQHQE